MANTKTSLEATGGALKNADLIRYSEESSGSYASKKHNLQTLKTFFQAGAITAGNEFLTPEKAAASADPVYTLGDGTAQSFASYGKSLGEAQADAPLGGVTNVNDLIDTAFIRQVVTEAGNTGFQSEVHLGLYGERKYIIDKNIQPPKSLVKISPSRLNIDLHGSAILTTSTTEDIFNSLPDDQSERDNVTVNCLIRISRGTLGALSATTKGSGQVAIRLGGRDVIIDDILTSNFDNGIELQGCLNYLVEKCSFTGFKTSGLHIREGQWSGASLSNAAANGGLVYGCRSNPVPGCDYGFHIEDASDTTCLANTIEGSMGVSPLSAAPKAAIFYDTLNATAARGTFQIKGLYLEQFFTEACVRIKGREGIYAIEDMSNQNQGLDDTECRDYLRLESYAGQVYFELHRFAHWTPNGQFYLGGADCHPLFIYPWSVPDADFLDDPTFWSNAVPTLGMLQKSIYHG